MIKIAAVQMNVIAGKPELNFEKMRLFIEQAINQKFNLVAFSEMCLPGYLIGDLWEYPSFLKDCEFFHGEIAKLSEKIHIIFGSVGCDWHKTNEDGSIRKYNAAFLASHGNLIQNNKLGYSFWPKTLLPNYREFNDSRYFFSLKKLAAERNSTIENLYCPMQISVNQENYNIGISICEDSWDQNYSFKPMQKFSELYKHDFLINLSSSPFHIKKNIRRKTIFSKQVETTKTPLLFINNVGVQNLGKNIYGFDGRSSAYDLNGISHNLGKPFEENMFEISFIKEEKRWHPSALQIALMQTLPKDSTGCQENTKSEEMQESLEYILRIICQEWKIERVIIGVSGGIDSALSTVLFSRVLGPQNTILVNMPSKYNSELTKNSAKKLAENLKCPYAQIPIQESFEYSQKQILSKPFLENSLNPRELSMAVLENIQARDRGSRILAALAATFQGVFVCNANKTETTVGYGTLYGDLCGFLSPIGDLWKHEIYQLAQYYNTCVYGAEVIPREIFEVVPSAELSPEQDVTKGKGDPITYEYHDYLFRAWVEKKLSPEECLLAYLSGELENLIGCPKNTLEKKFTKTIDFCEDLEKWWSLYQGMGTVKRVQSPPLIVLSECSFGFDSREAIGITFLSQEYLRLKKNNVTKKSLKAL